VKSIIHRKSCKTLRNERTSIYSLDRGKREQNKTMEVSKVEGLGQGTTGRGQSSGQMMILLEKEKKKTRLRKKMSP
jgi:hypothetical protein